MERRTGKLPAFSMIRMAGNQCQRGKNAMGEQGRDLSAQLGETSRRRGPVIGVIPARLASTRLPQKVLRAIAGEPLLAWVVRAAADAHVFDRLIVATDSDEVTALCRKRGWEFRETSPDLASGTDRVNAVCWMLEQEREFDQTDCVFVNIQGDEPLLRPEHFDALLRPFEHPDVEVSTLRVPCPEQDAVNPNVVKVVVDDSGRALYFSRASIPWDRDGAGDIQRWKHLGIYAYRPGALRRFAELPSGKLEKTERLEQLRMLEHGIPIQVETVEFDTIGVDTEEDLREVEARLVRRESALGSTHQSGPRKGTKTGASDTLMAGDHG
jgi:3-deoxy-manno-octulosonate cytidylyltransferase (CMP-KDO synthetase)